MCATFVTVECAYYQSGTVDKWTLCHGRQTRYILDINRLALLGSNEQYLQCWIFLVTACRWHVNKPFSFPVIFLLNSCVWTYASLSIGQSVHCPSRPADCNFCSKVVRLESIRWRGLSAVVGETLSKIQEERKNKLKTSWVSSEIYHVPWCASVWTRANSRNSFWQ